MLLHKRKIFSFTRGVGAGMGIYYNSSASGKEEEREAVLQPLTNLLLMNEMRSKALMLLCLQFHFVMVTDDDDAVLFSAITQEFLFLNWGICKRKEGKRIISDISKLL